MTKFCEKKITVKLFLMGFLALGFLSACDSPCRSLAKLQCECFEGETQKRNCLESINLFAKNDRSFEEDKVCEEALKTCTCKHYLAGDPDGLCGQQRTDTN